MINLRGVLPITLAVGLAFAPIGVAHADGVSPLASHRNPIIAKGNPGPELKPGKVVKKSARRNHETYAGGRPLWVQMPVVVKRDGKYSVRASASMRAFHRDGAHPKARADKATLTIAVLKKGKTVPTKQTTTLLKTERVKVKDNGVQAFKIAVSNKGARQLDRLLKSQSKRLYVTLAHAKDTYPNATKDLDFQQVALGGLTAKVLGTKQARRLNKRNVTAQKRWEKGKAPAAKTAGARLSNLNQLYYTSMYTQNNSPFTQAVTFNPNIQCMNMGVSWTGLTPTTTVPANTGGVQLFFGSANDEEQWYGRNDGNPSGSTPSEVQALANAGRETLVGVEDAVVDPETYSESGLITAGIGAVATFGVSLLVDLIKAQDGCGDYGQFWGVSSTALYVGTPSSPNTVYGNPYYWSTGAFTTTGYGGTSSTIGQPQTFNENPPATPGSSDWTAMEAMLNAAVGQQTQSTYFHNAGMPAPIANAGGNSQWSGMASFSQGLIQWMYPNPGSCANNDCDTGESAIQLGYMMDGFDGPVGPQMTALPVASVGTGTDANTGESVTQVSCQVPNTGTFVNPFTGSQGAPGPASAPELNSLQGMQGVANAQFVVAYYAQDAAGNYLYNSGTTTSSTYPGPLAGDTAYGASEYPPTLQVSDNAVQLLGMNEAQNATQLDLSAGDLSSLIDPTTGAAASAVQFGCVAIPVVEWQNMDITSSSVWGGNWPFPQTSAGGPLSSPYNNYFNWMNSVNAINLAWSGDPYISTPVPAP